MKQKSFPYIIIFLLSKQFCLNIFIFVFIIFYIIILFIMNRDCINFLMKFKLTKSKHTLVTFILFIPDKACNEN